VKVQIGALFIGLGYALIYYAIEHFVFYQPDTVTTELTGPRTGGGDNTVATLPVLLGLVTQIKENNNATSGTVPFRLGAPGSGSNDSGPPSNLGGRRGKPTPDTPNPAPGTPGPPNLGGRRGTATPSSNGGFNA